MAPKQAPALFDQLKKSLTVEGEDLASKIKVCTVEHVAMLIDALQTVLTPPPKTLSVSALTLTCACRALCSSKSMAASGRWICGPTIHPASQRVRRQLT